MIITYRNLQLHRAILVLPAIARLSYNDSPNEAGDGSGRHLPRKCVLTDVLWEVETGNPSTCNSNTICCCFEFFLAKPKVPKLKLLQSTLPPLPV